MNKRLILTMIFISATVCAVSEYIAHKALKLPTVEVGLVWTCETDQECQDECAEYVRHGKIKDLSECEGQK